MSNKTKITREKTENYLATSIPHIMLLLITLLFVPIMLSFGDDAAGFIIAASLAVFVPWVMNMLGVKEHRKNMDYHREYMRSIDSEE